MPRVVLTGFVLLIGSYIALFLGLLAVPAVEVVMGLGFVLVIGAAYRGPRVP